MSDEAKPYTKADSNEDNWSNVLLRPDGSEVCILGEPEDRNFARDGSAILDELNCLAAERDSLRAQRDALNAMLKRLEFSQGPGGLGRDPSGKCPVCLGWDGSPRGLGETRLRHTKDCELAALLRAKGEKP